MATVARPKGKPNRTNGRPSVAVDVALLSLAPGDDGSPALVVLEVKRENDRGWQLPSVYLTDGETLDDAVRRCLHVRAGVSATTSRQLHVYSAPDRDGQGWVLSVAHAVAVPAQSLDGRATTSRIVSADAPGRLPYDHGDVVARAVDGIRARYQVAPDPDRLLGETFTLRELRLVHEAVAGGEHQRDTFRRAMEPLLVATGEVTAGTRGRPAETFARA